MALTTAIDTVVELFTPSIDTTAYTCGIRDLLELVLATLTRLTQTKQTRAFGAGGLPAHAWVWIFFEAF
jgi:hypothetical protein